MKRKLIPSLLLLGLIASCGGQNISSFGSSEPEKPKESTTSSSSSSGLADFDANRIMGFLDDIIKGDFEVNYYFNNESYTDVYTKSYSYVDYLGTGRILLDYGSGLTSFDFQMTSSGFDLLGQSYSDKDNTQGVQALENKLEGLYDDGVFEMDDIVEGNQGLFYTESEGFIDKFSNLLDFPSGIKRVVFDEEGDNLALEFQIFNVSNEYETFDGGYVYFSNVGNASNEAVDDFLEGWSKPDGSLASKNISVGTDFSYTASIYQDYGDGDMVYKGQRNIDSNNGSYRLWKKNSSDSIYSDEVFHMDGNTMKRRSVNGRNELVDEISEVYPDYDSLNLINDLKLDLSNFLQLSSGEYFYFGNKAVSMASALVKDEDMSRVRIARIRAMVDGSRLSSLVIDTEEIQDSSSGELFRYHASIDFLSKPNDVTYPSVKVKSADDTLIGSLIEVFKDEDSEFKATRVDSAWEGNRITEITKTSQAYLIQTFYASNGEKENLETGTGYYKKNGKIYQFRLIGDEVSLYANGTTGTLLGVVGFDAASEVFVMNSDKTAIESYSDISKLGESIGFSDYPEDVVASTFKATIADSKISEMTFDYSNKEVQGNEKVTFSYNGYSVDQDTISKMEALIPEEGGRHTWKEYSSMVPYDSLVAVLGEEHALKVPYLPDERMTETFDGYEYDDNDCFIYYYDANMQKDLESSYLQSYKDLLLSYGYTTEDGSVYVSTTDGLKITVGSTLDDFLHVSVVNN